MPWKNSALEKSVPWKLILANLCWHAFDDTITRDVVYDDGSRTDQRVRADFDSIDHGAADAEVDIFSDLAVPTNVDSWSYGGECSEARMVTNGGTAIDHCECIEISSRSDHNPRHD